jgi:hypothetical protein
MFFSLMHKTTNQRRGATRVRTLVRRDPAKLQLPAPQRQITVILDLIWCINYWCKITVNCTKKTDNCIFRFDMAYQLPRKITVNCNFALQLSVVARGSYDFKGRPN